jgi:hypothetical protein
LDDAAGAGVRHYPVLTCDGVEAALVLNNTFLLPRH